MPKKLLKNPTLVLEIESQEGQIVSETLDAVTARVIFAAFVSDCVTRHSEFKRISLIDKCGRVWKSYIQNY